MIKWSNGNVVLLYSAENEESGQQDIYTIDLSNHKFYLDEEDLEWTPDVTQYVHDSKEDCIRYVKEKIRNNQTVIRSTEKEGNLHELEKATRHLDRNQRLLSFIEEYQA